MIALTSAECWDYLIQATEEREEKKNIIERVGNVEYCYLQHCETFKKNEMGRACSMFGGDERCIQGFGGET